ncbi:eukaryotic translation initiation factor 3 subunit A, partial [Trifolium medium]|nr:eukaryotic translation initiation factor 3 subunit A [Trifolium medium]
PGNLSNVGLQTNSNNSTTYSTELSKQRHAEDLNEKKRLSRMTGNKEIYEEKVVNRIVVNPKKSHQ